MKLFRTKNQCLQDLTKSMTWPQPGRFYLPKNETKPDPMHLDLEVI